jgi:ABC-type amino acid transport substrate-binding protein
MQIRSVCFLLLSQLLWLGTPGSLQAQTNEESVSESSPLIVGVTASPPFSYNEAETWKGISVDLWKELAEQLDLEYEFRPVTVSEAIEGLTSGEIDVVSAALVATAERESQMDFSQSFYSSGLSIATSTEKRSPVLQFLKALFTIETFVALSGLGLLLLGVGAAIWLVERKSNPEQFGGSTSQGLGSGFWWSAVTMTTVGYGDKAPVSLAGRIVGLIWMFASIILISGFTGAIASALTVSSLSPRIEGLNDLYGAKVGVVSGSTGAAFLDEQGISARSFGSTEEGLAAVAAGKIDGFVNDAPVLQYYVSREYADRLVVLDQIFNPAFYTFALSQGFDQREALNRALLSTLEKSRWSQIKRAYLGEQGS